MSSSLPRGYAHLAAADMGSRWIVETSESRRHGTPSGISAGELAHSSEDFR